MSHLIKSPRAVTCQASFVQWLNSINFLLSLIYQQKQPLTIGSCIVRLSTGLIIAQPSERITLLKGFAAFVELSHSRHSAPL